MERCSINFANGHRCESAAIRDGKCFWHSDLYKTDENIEKYFPSFQTLKQIIETEHPNLEKAWFVKSDLKYINFSSLNLRGATFDYANLQECVFIESDLRSVYFKEVNLEKANLTKADLTKGAIEKSNLRYASLEDAVLVHTRVEQCDLSFANLRNTSLKSTKLNFSTLYQADLTGTLFSNKIIQLKFCSLDEPDIETYFKHKVFEWFGYEQKNDILKVIQFLQTKLNKLEFDSWMREVGYSLTQKAKIAKEKQELDEIADIWEFIARLYKILGTLPFQIALPNAEKPLYKKAHEEFLIIKSSLNNDRISVQEFTEVLQSFVKIIDYSQKIGLKGHIIENDIIPEIISISLQSPLEIAIIVPCAYITLGVILLYQKIVLQQYEIEKVKVELNQKQLELDEQRIAHSIRLREYQRRLENEFMMSAEESQKISSVIDEHIELIKNSSSFLDYKIETDNQKIAIKEKIELLPPKKTNELDENHNQLPMELYQKIVNFVTSLPEISTAVNQKALMFAAGLDHQLVNQLPVGIPPVQFARSLIATTMSYGKLKDGRRALEAILEATKQYIGQDRQEYCDQLIHELQGF